MKRFLSVLSTVFFLSTTLLPTGALAATYSGLDESNAFADEVISGYSTGATFEETTDATDTGMNDVTLPKSASDVLYIGYSTAFDGFALDIDTTATGGTFVVEYWDGASWETLVSETTASFQNDSSLGVFSVKWTDRPSDWNQTTVTMGLDESGNTNVSSSSAYFVRLRVTSAFTTRAQASQVGVLSYNARFEITDELGNAMTGVLDNISFSSSSGDSTVYAKKETGNGGYEYALYAPSSTTYNVTIDVPGYVEVTRSQTLSEVPQDISQMLEFSHVVIGYNPTTGQEVSLSSVTAGTGSESCTMNNGHGYCSLTPTEDNGSLTAYADGYAPLTTTLANRTSDSESQATDALTLVYAYVVTVTDEDDEAITDATVKAGDDLDLTCANLGSGQYGCSVSTSDTDGNLEISATEYETLETTFATIRNSNDDAQVTETFELEHDEECSSGDGCGNDDNEVDFDVEDIEVESDGDLTFTVENEGDLDTDDDEDVWIYVYIEGDREWDESYSQSSDDNFLDAGEDSTINLGDEDLLEDYDDGDEVEIEVCVDATDTVDESDEDNNCMERTFTIGDDDDDDDIDLEIEDLYIDDDGDLKFTVTNSGDDDVASGEYVYISVEVDGDQKWSKGIKQGNDDDEFLDAGDSTTFDIGDTYVEDEDEDTDVEVCVDYTENIDEDDEDNNCEKEDIEELEEGPDENDCSTFIDIDDHWGQDYICNLYERGTVEGRSTRLFEPDEDVSRAEFLKMVMLDAGLDPYATSNVYYDDVSSRDWYYSYVTYATTRGYVEGYEDGTFRPNDDISRGEAVVILMRVADEESWDFDESDIDYWDVYRSDWFAYAVVLCDEFNIVEGYGDGSFRPFEDLSRAEAAKIIDRAYEEFYE